MRKRWENGGKSTSINPDVWKSLLSGESHKNSVKGENPSLRPKEYNALNGTNIGRKVTEVPAEKEEKRFVGNLQPSKIYEPNEEKSDPHIVTPGFRRQLNEFDSSPEDSRITKYGNSSTTEETDDKEKAKTEEQGIIKPGYNAKGEWSEDPDADNYGKDSAKYKLLTVFDKAWDSASELDKKYVSGVVYNLRKFDESTICEVYYMNKSWGAGTMGHTGILLVNEKGEGILFSYGAATGDVFDGKARMNIGIYKGAGLDKIIAEGKKGIAIANTGALTTEQYNRWHGYEISNDSGKKMFEKAVDMTVNIENYNLIHNNCDQIVVEILNAGGFKYNSKVLPNFTYMAE